MSIMCDYNIKSTEFNLIYEDSINFSKDMDIYGVDLKFFGAVGDGITDDTDALVKAFSSDYDTIIVPEGTYMVRGGIEVRSNKRIVGSGDNSIIKLIKNSGDTNVLTAENSHNIELRNFKIDGNKEGYDNPKALTTCIYFEKCSGLVFQDLYITGGLIEGIYLYGSSNINLMDLNTSGNGFYRSDASGLHLDTCTNAKVNNLVTYNNGFHGLILSSTCNAEISNVTAKNNGWDGLRMQYESNNNTFRNIISENNTRGIYFTTDSNNNSVYDSSFKYSEFNGISLYNSTGNIFTNVYSTNNKESGFCIVDSGDSAEGINLILADNIQGETKLVSGSQLIKQ